MCQRTSRASSFSAPSSACAASWLTRSLTNVNTGDASIQGAASASASASVTAQAKRQGQRKP